MALGLRFIQEPEIAQSLIKQETVSEIFEAAHIEDVVGDFVNLKKRGTNMIGLCPFHNEKTPSFNVSPSKGIYKCFGCGKGGNSVNFIMEHEHLSYPEALKFLARKYNIEVEEKELSPEEKQAADARESLLIVSEAAGKFFQEQLTQSEEGRNIGLSYFKERGMDEAMIERFALGYCPEKEGDSFTKNALQRGFKEEFLLKTGITKQGQRGLYDFYHGRVIFPIRSISGRMLGFGARTLRSDKSVAKYFNSPESEIYNKSKVLYGLFESKSAIVKQDRCYMVEGYMDVISLHQAGIENVVASSGTSLTIEQIRLLRRYTPHITILYDSDNAGVKAAFRGIDLLLQEGMKVRVVSLPEGEDPDTMAQRLGVEDMLAFLDAESKDFFTYMCDTLLTGDRQDPIQRSDAIQEIIRSLALVPDKIERSLEIQSISLRLGVEQRVVNEEIKKAQRRHQTEQAKEREREAQRQARQAAQEMGDMPPPPGMEDMPPELEEALDRDVPLPGPMLDSLDSGSQELDIIRLLINYGGDQLDLPIEDAEEDEQGNIPTEPISVEEYIVEDLSNDPYIQFQDGFSAKVFALYQAAYAEERSLDVNSLLRHPDQTISGRVASMMSEKHELHRWEDRKIYPTREKEQLLVAVDTALDSYRLRTVLKMIRETQASIPSVQHDSEAFVKTVKRLDQLNKMKMRLSERFGAVILST